MILLDTHVWLWLLHDPSQLLVTCDAKILNYPFVKTIW